MPPQQLKAARTLAMKLAEGVKRPIPGTAPGANQQIASALRIAF